MYFRFIFACFAFYSDRGIRQKLFYFVLLLFASSTVTKNIGMYFFAYTRTHPIVRSPYLVQRLTSFTSVHINVIISNSCLITGE